MAARPTRADSKLIARRDFAIRPETERFECRSAPEGSASGGDAEFGEQRNCSIRHLGAIKGMMPGPGGPEKSLLP